MELWLRAKDIVGNNPMDPVQNFLPAELKCVLRIDNASRRNWWCRRSQRMTQLQGSIRMTTTDNGKIRSSSMAIGQRSSPRGLQNEAKNNADVSPRSGEERVEASSLQLRIQWQ